MKVNELSPVQRAFRNAMASLPASVNIITTAGAHGTGGLTVTAASSVTDTPPTVLVCVNRDSALHPVFLGNGRLALNVLADTQDQLALHFAGVTKVTMAERMSWDIWEERDGIPVLRDAVARLVGRVTSAVEIGTHSVLFVEIDDVDSADTAAGLVYFRRTFRPVSEPLDPGEADWVFYDQWSDPLIASRHAVPLYDEAYLSGAFAVPAQPVARGLHAGATR